MERWCLSKEGIEIKTKAIECLEKQNATLRLRSVTAGIAFQKSRFYNELIRVDTEKTVFKEELDYERKRERLYKFV